MTRLPADAPRRRPPRAAELLQREVLGNGAWEMLCSTAALAPPLSRPVAEIASHVWLSTAFERETVYIAAHRYHREEAGPYLLLVQRTLADFGARPHWGKMHWLGARDLSRLYPRFEDFRAVRRAADPEGQLMTPALRHLLGA